MSVPAGSQRVPAFKNTSQAASVIVMLIGGLALIGWTFAIESLKSGLPGLTAMNPVTALAFILAGVSLGLLGMKQAGPRARRIGKACASIVALVGLIQLGGYLLGLDIGIDQFFFREKLGSQGFYPNRMAPNTALNFFLLGSALLLLDLQALRRGRRPDQYLTLLATLVSLLALTGYAYGLKPLYGVSSYIPMALNTAIGFAVLCAGVLFARPDQGWMAVVISDNAGGILARRLLPAVIGIPMILGWVRLAGQRAGLYGTEFGVSLTALMSIILLAIVVWWSSAALNRTDAERKRAAEAVKESEQRLDLALDSAQMGAWDLDLINDTAVRSLKHDQIFGYPSLQPEWGSEIFMTHILPEDRDLVKKRFEEAFATGHFSTECRIIWPDQSLHWIAAQGRVYRNHKGDPVRMMGVVTDITERKQAEDAIRKLNENLQAKSVQLEAANKELEAFSYSVSHDLRAPLRHIDGFGQILLEDYAGMLDDEGRRYLHRVREASQQMAQLIDDLLNLSRVTRAEMHRETVDLSRTAEMVAAALRKIDPEKAAEFVIEKGLTAVGDERLLRVALDNLLGNAWKYTGKRPQARIEFGRTNHDGRSAYFVRDNGAGFDMAYAHKLFGAFQRLHSMSEFPGTGIGLATVQRIIHRHGGQVWADGTVDKGATFYFTL